MSSWSYADRAKQCSFQYNSIDQKNGSSPSVPALYINLELY